MKTQEKKLASLSGAVVLVFWLLLAAVAVWLIVQFTVLTIVLGALLVLLLLVFLAGFYIVQPNYAVVATFFGRYVGSQLENGWFWTNPFTVRKSISMRLRNFNSEKLKVNDAGGNPIEIAAVIVWKVVDSAKASFDIDSYENFVSIQAETALRHLANNHPYDDHDAEVLSLRGNSEDISDILKQELQKRLHDAGVDVVEARLSHLAYAAEIAQAMLQRQQATAILAARQKIVEGAVSMVQMALKKLSDERIVELDEERKAQMVSNLLVVLTSEKSTQPVINAGSLY